MKRLRTILSYKIIAVCLATLMLSSSAFASVSPLNFKSIEPINIEGNFKESIFSKEKKTTCFWYKARNYYSDATLTTHVGVRVWYCDGYVGVAGSQTAFYVEEFCECDPQS